MHEGRAWHVPGGSGQSPREWPTKILRGVAWKAREMPPRCRGLGYGHMCENSQRGKITSEIQRDLRLARQLSV